MTASRVARKPVAIPSGVEVRVQNKKILAKGPRGQLEIDLHPYVEVVVENNQVAVRLNAEQDTKITGAGKRLHRSIAGTVRAKINNLIHGVSKGFELKLVLVGVGYRAQTKGKVLVLSLGYSHPTEYHLPEGVTVETPTPTEIVIKGASRELVGQAAIDIRNYREPDAYKGKGVQRAGEIIVLKETKKK
jgi:large subunit ribosomal protein L6